MPGVGVDRCVGHRGRGGDYARYVWEKAPASAVKVAGRHEPADRRDRRVGRPTGGGAGHIGISVGGGGFISATGGVSSGRTSRRLRFITTAP